MDVNALAREHGAARFTRSAFILGSLGFAAAVAGIRPGRLVDTATAAAAVDGCEWVPWEMAHGLTGGDFSSRDAELSADGYRLVRISGYGSGSTPLLTGIWELRPTANHIFELALTQASFTDRNRTHQGHGYRLLAVDGFSLKGAARYNGIWERTPGAPRLQVGMKAQAFRDKLISFARDGYRLVDLSGFELNGSSRFAGLWRKDGPPTVIADIDMSEADFNSSVESLENDGLLPVDVSAYQVGDAIRYAAIWTGFSASIGLKTLLDPASLDLESDARRYRGQRPVMVDAYPRAGQRAYTTVWRRDGITAADEDELVAEIEGSVEDDVQSYMEQYGIPGLSLAFAKDGRLVYARGFGVTAKDGTEPVTIHSRFRVGSVSKPITAVAVMKLVSEHRLRLGDRVLGDGALLGTRYWNAEPTFRSWDPQQVWRMQQITVAHLLEHTAGGWANDATGLVWEPVEDCKSGKQPDQVVCTELDQAGLIAYVLRQAGTAEDGDDGAKYRLLDDPGTTHRYSGLGYLLLAQIIEKITGEDYETYVREAILGPDSTMQVAGADRLANEVEYYSQESTDPYALLVTRANAAGGWLGSAIDLVRFMTSVDGDESTRPDVLPNDARESMLTASPAGKAAPGGRPYALGWIIDPDVQGMYYHGGTLAGTEAMIARRRGDDGSVYCWAGVANSRLHRKPLGIISDLKVPMEEWFALVQSWPCLDLF